MDECYVPETSSAHLASVAPWLSADKFEAALIDVHDRGYVIIEDVLSAGDCDDYRQILEHFMAVSPMGRNVFEGTSSHRLYALLAKSERFADMIEHPLALAFAEHFLGESCLLSACLSINLHPGETVQPWHTDDGHISVPQPHDVFGISVFWALDDTTETMALRRSCPTATNGRAQILWVDWKTSILNSAARYPKTQRLASTGSRPQ